MVYATAEQLRVHLDLATIDTARANQLLDRASKAVRSAAGVTIDEATETITVDGTGTGVILLPNYPVTAITSVTEDGTALVVDDDYTWARSGVLERVKKSWPTKQRSVVVAYTHGYVTADLPEELGVVTVDVAARAWQNPIDVRQEGIGNYTASYGAGVSLTPDEVEMVRRAIR